MIDVGLRDRRPTIPDYAAMREEFLDLYAREPLRATRGSSPAWTELLDDLEGARHRAGAWSPTSSSASPRPLIDGARTGNARRGRRGRRHLRARQALSRSAAATPRATHRRRAGAHASTSATTSATCRLRAPPECPWSSRAMDTSAMDRRPRMWGADADRRHHPLSSTPGFGERAGPHERTFAFPPPPAAGARRRARSPRRCPRSQPRRNPNRAARAGLPLRRQRRLQHVGAVHGRALLQRCGPRSRSPRDAVLKVTDTPRLPSVARAAHADVGSASELALVQGIGYARGHAAALSRQRDGVHGIRRPGVFGRGLGHAALARSARDTSGEDAIAFDVLDIREADPMGPFRGDKPRRRAGVLRAGSPRAHASSTSASSRPTTRGRARLARIPGRLPAVPLEDAVSRRSRSAQAMRAAVELASIDRTLPVIHVALNGLDGDKHHSVDCHWDQLKYHGDALSRLAEWPRGAARGPEGDRPLGRDARRDLRRVRPLADGERGPRHAPRPRDRCTS